MTIEVSLIIAIISLGFALYSGIFNLKRNRAADNRQAASQLTQVMVKLDIMNDMLSEIKADIGNIRSEVQDLRERLVIVEQASKSLHHRMDALEEKNDDIK